MDSDIHQMNHWNPAGMIENKVLEEISGKGQDMGD
jgi:hypothetical protein